MLSVAMVLIGVALLVEAALGVGGLSVRLIAGVLFVAAGVGRIYVESRRGDRGLGAPGGEAPGRRRRR